MFTPRLSRIVPAPTVRYQLSNARSGEVLHQGSLTACLRWQALYELASARLGYAFTPRIERV